MDPRTEQRGWDRHEWASVEADLNVPTADAEPAIPAWNLIQWVGDRPGVVREPAVVDVTTDGKPHGFSGFGVSDSGGQRWASVRSSAVEHPALTATHEAQQPKAA